MLKLKNYKIIYENKTISFPDISIKVNEFWGISGESGCGKTSLLESLFGYDFRGETQGEVKILDGQKLEDLGNEKYKFISYCPQFAQDSLNPKLKIKEHIDLVLFSNNIDICKEYLENLMAKLKLSPLLLEDYPYMLSGGQKQRIVLLLCYIKNPKLLVLDEPSSAIDMVTLKLIAEFLEEIKGKITIVMVSHNMDFLNKLCDKVIELRG